METESEQLAVAVLANLLSPLRFVEQQTQQPDSIN